LYKEVQGENLGGSPLLFYAISENGKGGQYREYPKSKKKGGTVGIGGGGPGEKKSSMLPKKKKEDPRGENS